MNVSNYCLENVKNVNAISIIFILYNIAYLDGGATGKAHHHYQGQAGLQKEDFYNCNKFWFGCTMDVDIYLPNFTNFC